jgi:hypothetical protein
MTTADRRCLDRFDGDLLVSDGKASTYVQRRSLLKSGTLCYGRRRGQREGGSKAQDHEKKI